MSEAKFAASYLKLLNEHKPAMRTLREDYAEAEKTLLGLLSLLAPYASDDRTLLAELRRAYHEYILSSDWLFPLELGEPSEGAPVLALVDWPMEGSPVLFEFISRFRKGLATDGDGRRFYKVFQALSGKTDASTIEYGRLTIIEALSGPYGRLGADLKSDAIKSVKISGPHALREASEMLFRLQFRRATLVH